jgi:R3H domain
MVPCDERCEVENRNKRLREALGVSESTSHNAASSSSATYLPYPKEFLVSIKESGLSVTLERIESILYEAAVGKHSRERVFNMRPMPYNRRWLVHQLAPHYNFETESIGNDPNRFVRLTRSLTTTLPAVAVSEAVQLFTNNPELCRTLEADRVMYLQHLERLPGIRPTDVHEMLRHWQHQYRLNWISGENAIVAFFEPHIMQEARRHLLSQQIFQCDQREPNVIVVRFGAVSIAAGTTSVSRQDRSSNQRASSKAPGSEWQQVSRGRNKRNNNIANHADVDNSVGNVTSSGQFDAFPVSDAVDAWDDDNGGDDSKKLSSVVSHDTDADDDDDDGWEALLEDEPEDNSTINVGAPGIQVKRKTHTGAPAAATNMFEFEHDVDADNHSDAETEEQW